MCVRVPKLISRPVKLMV